MQGAYVGDEGVEAGGYGRGGSVVVVMLEGDGVSEEEKGQRDRTYSPSSQPSVQMSHGLSTSKPCPARRARISRVRRPSYALHPSHR